MAQAADEKITDPQRVKSFVKYFNNYIAAITIAVIPIPIANWNWLPIFDVQRHLLSVVTPIFCFLTIALLFFYRQFLARMMFYDHLVSAKSVGDGRPSARYLVRTMSEKLILMVLSLAPLLLTLGSLWSASQYYVALITGIRRLPGGSAEGVQLGFVPNGGETIFYFILSFVLVEAAFVWMALKEYLQDVLKFTDESLILRPRNLKAVSAAPGGGSKAVSLSSSKPASA